MCPGSGTTTNSFTGNISTGKYDNKWYCVWTIAPPNASRVTLTFLDFFTEGPAPGTVGDWAYVWECADSTCSNLTLLGGFAGTAAIVPPSITAATGVMRVQFFSDDGWSRSGFRATYRTPCPPGSFGQEMPHCAPCRTACPAGKVLFDSCGGFDSVADSACVCPAGEYESASTCLPCGSCGPGATSTSSPRVRPFQQSAGLHRSAGSKRWSLRLPLALLTLCAQKVPVRLRACGWLVLVVCPRSCSHSVVEAVRPALAFKRAGRQGPTSRISTTAGTGRSAATWSPPLRSGPHSRPRWPPCQTEACLRCRPGKAPGG